MNKNTKIKNNNKKQNATTNIATNITKTIGLTAILSLSVCNFNTIHVQASTIGTNNPHITDLHNNIITRHVSDFLPTNFPSNLNNTSVLEDTESGAKAYTTKTMYTNANVNIRVKPDLKSKSIKILPFGTKITVVNNKSNKKSKWTKIEYKNKFRYIHSDYLVSEKPKVLDVYSIKLSGLSEVQKQRAYTIARICINEWDTYGVLPSVAIAQAMVESTLGKHCSGNNLWGIASGAISYDSLESGVYGYLKVINNGCYGSAPFTRDSSSQINKILSGGYCVPVGEYYENAMWIINHYGLERFDALIIN